MTYKYVSALSPNDILTRIRSRAHPTAKGWRYTSDTLFYDIIDDKNFMLIYNGFAGSAGGQTPFWGKITAENGQTVITGRFSPSKKALRVFIPFSLLPVVFLMAMGEFSMLLMLTPIFILWFCMVLGTAYIATPLLWPKRRKHVLAFINAHLTRI